MTKTRVVNLSRAPRSAINIGRRSIFGNPFDAEKYGREIACELHKVYLWRLAELDESFAQALEDLDGKVLACPGNCKPKRCHGDNIVEWLEQNQPIPFG